MPLHDNTPGVYVKEISTLPPSVAEVSTAIPAFIGYTEKNPNGDEVKAVRINTLLDYENLFGSAKPTSFTVTASGDDIASISKSGTGKDYLMYYCLKMYFDNGGGSCYIISVGDYSGLPSKDDYVKGLAELAKEDEPTLILLTDAVNLDPADYYALCNQSLIQCGALMDRFAILDVLDDADGVKNFRNTVAGTDLKFGAAYTPFLRTSIAYQYKPDSVTITGLSAQLLGSHSTSPNGLRVTYSGPEGDNPKLKVLKAGSSIEISITDNMLSITGVSGKSVDEVIAAWDGFAGDRKLFELSKAGDGSDELDTIGGDGVSLTFSSEGSASLKDLESTHTGLYNKAKALLAKQRVTLPPSAAIAGVYAKTDRQRGVWKAPANIAVQSVIAPTKKITHGDQNLLNIDPVAGKSINAIRTFTGKGILVWGARTLAGNDNEWKYVPVRRLFNLIEESTKKSTEFAVFEPNDASTWLKVKAMIESYLYSLWQQGALAGPTPEAAYYVNVGLGKTMTTDDILNGRMIVEMGIAAVRPAEFIVLKFSHKLQEA